jgi:hypothetical protein
VLGCSFDDLGADVMVRRSPLLRDEGRSFVHAKSLPRQRNVDNK